MCGICGFTWEDKELAKQMILSLHHRGPDQGGIYADSNVTLGHRRLSIIDLSASGSQPMANDEGDVIIIYNGEIYNFQELRQELEQANHRFYSGTDTEVILHGYEEWGEDVVQKLNGMFAFCIYDIAKNKLFLARDRMGIKPLYYYKDKTNFIFASEIKAILLAGVKREVNLSAAKSFLNLRYIPGEETLFQGIKKLLPGHTLTFSDSELIIRRYWDVPLPKKSSMSSFQAGVAVREILQDSVKRQLVADVPVGVYLSGGIDSSAITALASQLKDDPVKTFSVGFNYDDQVDELTKARKIAEHFQTDHQEIVVEGSISQLLPRLLWHLDMPHGDPVIIPQFKLAELASKKVKVVLSGEGADELFAGYTQYNHYLRAQKLKYLPFKTKIAEKLSLEFLDKQFDYPSSIGEKGREKFLEFLDNVHQPEESYAQLTSILSKEDHRRLFTDSFAEMKTTLQPFEQERKPLLNRLLYQDIKQWLPNYVLQINDRMTMAHSIEGRVPFLDHRLVEFSMTLPPSLKLQGNITKVALRESMKGILPNVQEKKHAFFMPLDRWVKEELHGLAEQLFTPAQVKQRGYFNYYHLKKIWENYDQSKLLYGKQLFTMINFELWQRMFIDSDTVPRKEIQLSGLV